MFGALVKDTHLDVRVVRITFERRPDRRVVVVHGWKEYNIVVSASALGFQTARVVWHDVWLWCVRGW